MSPPAFALFDTTLGRLAIAWGARGVLGVHLPESREAETRARLLRRFPEAREVPPPPEVQRAADGIAALLRGEAADLSGVALDMEGLPEFERRVYDVARTIPPGSTLSYGEIAARLGERGAAPAVGRALARNPFSIVVPCHRVLAAGGRIGGFSAHGGVARKLKLLTIEGTRAGDQPGLFDGSSAYGFDPDAAVAHLRAVDPALGKLIDAAGPFRMALRPAPSLFFALAESITYQQLSGRAAATIFARFCALFPNPHRGPSPEQVGRTSDERLRAAGLSRAKILALRDLAQKARAGAIPTLAEARGLADDELVARLGEVRGIGRWTVEMLLMFRLGRPDVLPTGDYGVRKGYSLTFRKRALPSPKQLEKRGERWRPYRTVASWYLWRALELADGRS